MAVYKMPYDLDEWKRKIASIVRETDGMHYDDVLYWDTDNLYPGYKNIPSGSKTHHYLKKAEDNGILERIENHIDPLGFNVKAHYYISSGLLSKHKHYIRFTFWDLDKIKLLARDDDAVVSQNHRKYEKWNFYCNSDHSRVMDFKDRVSDQLRKEEV